MGVHGHTWFHVVAHVRICLPTMTPHDHPDTDPVTPPGPPMPVTGSPWPWQTHGRPCAIVTARHRRCSHVACRSHMRPRALSPPCLQFPHAPACAKYPVFPILQSAACAKYAVPPVHTCVRVRQPPRACSSHIRPRALSPPCLQFPHAPTCAKYPVPPVPTCARAC